MTNDSDDFFSCFEESNHKEKVIKSIYKLPSNYVGSKRRLLRDIWDFIDEKQVKFDSVLDAFSGSAIVSLLFKKMNKKVYCNDLLTSSSITAVSLLENESIPLTEHEMKYLCQNRSHETSEFVAKNYLNKFFTHEECVFLDNYRRNVDELTNGKLFCGLDIINKSLISSIPNSNFTVTGRDLNKIRSVHDPASPFWKEKWRDTTRKYRDENNQIKFDFAIDSTTTKYKSAFAMFAANSHINKKCFLGGRFYNGQTLAKLEHRIKRNENIATRDPINISAYDNFLTENKNQVHVFNSDIIDLLKSKTIQADLIYLDPPYGKNSSDYANLYRFLEEYVYEETLDNLEHIQNGAKRFVKSKGYQEQFEELLSLCDTFPTWMLSYNESSYADIDTIVSTIKNAGRANVLVKEIPITYQYRKAKGSVDAEHFKNNFLTEGHKFTERGTEYLIIAR